MWIRAGVAALLLGLCFTVYHTQCLLDREREIRFIDRVPVFLPNGKILKALSMGHYTSLADYFWLHSVIYFGRRAIDHDNMYYLHMLSSGDVKQAEHLKEDPAMHKETSGPRVSGEKQQQWVKNWHTAQSGKPQPPDSIPFMDSKAIPRIFDFPNFGTMDYIFPLIDRVTQLNPYFITPYIFSSVVVLSATGEIDWAIHLLERGYRNNAMRWELPFYLGYIHWIYKGDAETMVRYLKEAVQKPDCPEYVDGLLIGFSRNLKQEEITGLYFKSMLESTQNREIRERIQELLTRLESE